MKAKAKAPAAADLAAADLVASELAAGAAKAKRGAVKAVVKVFGCCIDEASGKCRGYHHGDLRESLLRAARGLLAERGVHGTSLRAIARRAGVSNRAPYHHFADKMSLLAEVAREGFEELGRRMSSHEDVVDPDQRLGLLGIDYVAFAGEFPTDFATMYWPELCDQCNFPDREECSRPAFDPLIRALSEIAGPRASEDDLQQVAVAGWAAVHGLATLRAQGVLNHMVEDGGDESTILGGVLKSTHRMLVREAEKVGGRLG